jgi:hypothetical protein
LSIGRNLANQELQYELTTGNPGFLEEASGIIFGQSGISPVKVSTIIARL